MLARVITIRDHGYSETSADRCIASAQEFGITVEKFYGITVDTAYQALRQYGLEWTWADMNQRVTVCPHTKLTLSPYRALDIRAKIACSMSHYLLWRFCVEVNEPLLILEHDAVFIRALPEIEFHGAIQINDPNGGGYKGRWHQNEMIKRGTTGAHPLTAKQPPRSSIPDGFSGNSAYIVKPWAAKEFVQAFHRLGVWPNDATICLQIFPWLQELYPFVTNVQQNMSTTTS